MPFGILITDLSDNIIWTNDIMKDLIEVIPSSENDISQDEHISAALQPFLSSKGTFPILDPLCSTEIWLKHTELTMENDDGDTIIVHLYEDVTDAKEFQQERDQLSEKLRKQAPVDTLTNLPTQHAILQSLRPLVSLSRRYEKPLSIVMLEIGKLENYDEETGEPTAGEILVSLSRLLKDQMRWADLIGRFNNNQFLLVLPETTSEAAAKLVNKIHPKITQLEVAELPYGPITLEPNFGISQWMKGDDSQRLLRRAIKALETARENADKSMEIS